MAVYLSENDEAKKNQEIEDFKREREAEIEEARINGKARRVRQDKFFQKCLMIVILIILIMLVISWAR